MKAEESESDHEGNGKTRCSKPSACLWLWWSQWQHGPASRSTDSVVTSIKAIFVIGSSWVEEDSIYVIELFFQAIMVDSTSWYRAGSHETGCLVMLKKDLTQIEEMRLFAPKRIMLYFLLHINFWCGLWLHSFGHLIVMDDRRALATFSLNESFVVFASLYRCLCLVICFVLVLCVFAKKM